MTYTKQIWKDKPSTDTPMSAARWNHMEDGIGNAHDDIAEVAGDLSGLQGVVDGFGDSVTHPAADFATAAQGGVADSAVQPGDLADVATSGSYSDLVDVPDGLMRMMGGWDASANDPALANNAVDPVQSSVGFTGLSSAYGVAVDSDGTVYVADYTNKQVYKMTAGGVQSSVGFTSLSSAYGVAVDSDGTVYVADSAAKQVVKRTTAGAQSSVGFTGLTSARGVAVDSDGTVYVADLGGIVYKRTSAGVQSSVGFTGLSSARFCAVDSDGTVYVTDTAGSVYKRTAAGMQSSVGVTGVSDAQGVAVDSDGAVYVADYTNKQVQKRTAAGAQSSLGFTGLGNVYSVAVDSDGTVYVADYTNKQVQKMATGGDHTKGHLYRVTTAGTAKPGTNTLTVTVGDYVIHDGTQWAKM